MDHAFTLVGLKQVHEHGTLRLEAFFKGQLNRGLNGAHCLSGADLPTSFLEGLGKGCIPVDGFRSGHFADGATISLLSNEGIGKDQSNGFRITFFDLIDNAHFQCFGRLHRCARGDDAQRRFHPNQSRQTLRAACARKQAQMHFRKAYAGGGLCNAVMGGQSDLQPAAQRHTVHGGDDQQG